MNRRELKYTQSIYGVLAILSTGPQSGYDIRKTLDHPEMFYWRESYGNIYPMLNKLFQDGLVDKADTSLKGRKRLMYKLNGNGWGELRKWLDEPANLSRFRVEILMKLRFGGSGGVENMISQLTLYGKQCEDQMSEAEHLLEQINDSEESLINDLRKITINLFYGRKITTLDWCSKSIEILKKWELAEKQEHSVNEINTSFKIETEAESAAARMNSAVMSPSSDNVVSVSNKIIPLME